jgi:phosphoglycerol transferase MdoB-like AlkP superfamily enzyme
MAQESTPDQQASAADSLSMDHRAVVRFVLIALAFLTSARFALGVWQWPAIGALSRLGELMYWGLRVDLQTLGLLSIPLIAWTAMFGRRRTRNLWQVGAFAYVGLMLGTLVLLELATPAFILQYDVRPNRIYFEYLSYPRVVTEMLVKSHPVSLVLALLGASLTARFLPRLVLTSRAESEPWLRRAPALTLLLILAAVALRGSLGHRPMSPARAVFTSSTLVNNLALNSFYSVANAIYGLKYEGNRASDYGHMAPEIALGIVRRESHLDPTLFMDSSTTLHRPPGRSGDGASPLHFVLILEESLGAEFVGHLGGRDDTPQLDIIAGQGWQFSNMFATGTRSVRGIEAVISGFPPTANPSVVKLDRAQQHFYTIARSFERAGYRRTFLYGGDASFDNMRRFLVNNGFDRVIEERDMEDARFVGSWGASDEDLFDALHDEMLAAELVGQPTFAFAFTSSNHEPFEFPIDYLEETGEPGTVNAAVRYADVALGNYFETARASTYWDNTVFLIVADHNSRTYGPDLVPIESFHIPAVFLGGTIEPRVDTRLVSQLDLPPTILSLLGISDPNPMIGQDLTDPESGGRAIMQFHQLEAYREGEHVVVLQPGRQASHWSYGAQGLSPAATDLILERRALAYPVWGEYAYRNGQYCASEPAYCPARQESNP